MKKTRIGKKHWLRCRPIAHRGLHNEEYPENSLAAFENAVNKGVPIELDVHISTDGVLFVFHDDNALRMTGEDRDVNSLTIGELGKLRLVSQAAKTDQEMPEHQIPELSQVLDMVRGQVPVLIETKKTAKPGRLEQELHRMLGEYRSLCEREGRKCEIAIQSFDPRSIRLMKKKSSRYITGQLSKNMSGMDIPSWQKWMMTGCRLNFYGRPDFISYKFKDLPYPRIEKMRREGMLLLGWTVRSEKDRKKAMKHCDNIIFEKTEAS